MKVALLRKKKCQGITKPVALIGTSEKGYLSLEFSVNKKADIHLCLKSETAIDILLKGNCKIESQSF
jgi:carboxypeptidase PM20D1